MNMVPEECSICSGSGEVELSTGSTEACASCVSRELNERIAQQAATIEQLTKLRDEWCAEYTKLRDDAFNLKSPVHDLCNQNLAEALAAAIEQTQKLSEAMAAAEDEGLMRKFMSATMAQAASEDQNKILWERISKLEAELS